MSRCVGLSCGLFSNGEKSSKLMHNCAHCFKVKYFIRDDVILASQYEANQYFTQTGFGHGLDSCAQNLYVG